MARKAAHKPAVAADKKKVVAKVSVTAEQWGAQLQQFDAAFEHFLQQAVNCRNRLVANQDEFERHRQQMAVKHAREIALEEAERQRAQDRRQQEYQTLLATYGGERAQLLNAVARMTQSLQNTKNVDPLILEQFLGLEQ